MDVKGSLLQSSSLLVPLLWSQFGPLAIRFLTGLANQANRYVPREWQQVVSGVLGALLAGLSGDSAAGIGLGAVAGVVSQRLAGADPTWMRTSAKA